MNLTEELLPTHAPLSEKFEQISAWLLSMGYEARHHGGYADDRDWDVTFVALDQTYDPQSVWVFHGETRQGLARTLVRYVVKRK
jgi:hypothetical protein